MSAVRAFAREHEGQTVVLVALLMSTMLLAAGLAVDTGKLMVSRRSMQDAADAGALGGATTLYQGGTAAQATTNATSDVTAMGFSSGSPTGTTVTVNTPPTSGAFAGNTAYVEVIIAYKPRTYFLPSSTVTARGVAGTTPGGTAPAILALDRSANPAIDTQGNGSISVTGGDVYSDSSGDKSLNNGGNGTITVGSPYGIKTVGGTQSGGFSPAPQTGKPVLSDPFSGYTKPACPAGTSGCTTGFQSCCSSTIGPGVYSSITLSSNSNVTMSPGTYIIRGGGITLSGNGDLTGTGVFIFITTTAYPNSGTTCQGLSITGNGDLIATAPTSGTYKGMLIYQDPSCSATMDLSGNGNGTSTTGTIYAPSAEISLHGNGDLAVTELIADTVDLGGNGALTVSYSSAQNAQSMIPALGE